MAEKTRRLLAALLTAAAIAGGVPTRAWAATSEDPEDLPVRSSEARIRSLIAIATGQSATFRKLSERVKETAGLVYVEPGRCGHGVRACLTTVTKAGNRRILFVKIDARKSDVELMASIGHELQHATEVLDSTVSTTTGLYLFYTRAGFQSSRGAFETHAAIEAGYTVAAELRKSGVGGN